MTPGRSQNLMSTYSTFSSEMYLSTSSELLNTLTDSFDWMLVGRHAMGGGVARPSLVSFAEVNGDHAAVQRLYPGSVARWIESWMPGTAASRPVAVGETTPASGSACPRRASARPPGSAAGWRR